MSGLLTPAEFEVMRLAALGNTYEEIAHARGCAVSTVKNLMMMARAGLGAPSQVEAYIILGWLQVPDSRKSGRYQTR